MANRTESNRPRVVIVGAGFAGLAAVKALRRKPVRVTLIDRNNYHEFQPLLYQVATAGLEPDEIAHNVREIFRNAPNVFFRMGTVEAVDAAAKQVHLHDGAAIDYDHLILAAGAVTNDFGVEGVEQNTFPLKNIPDAIGLRNHILRLFERLDHDAEAATEAAHTFVLVGGGPTGVEMAGALVELFDVMRKDYRHVDTTDARVILVEREDDLLGGYPKKLRAYTRRILEKRGVEIRTGATVARYTDGVVYLERGETIPAETVVWAAGVRGHPLGETLPAALEAGARVPVEPDLSVPSLPDVFVAGDLAGGKDDDGELLPQVAQVAIQQGRHAARQILRRLDGQPTEAFRYKDLGQMATIGRHAAVAEFPGGFTIKGILAWAMWAFIHIWKLVGFRNRLNVFVNWIYNYFTYDRNARLLLDIASDEAVERLKVEGSSAGAASLTRHEGAARLTQ